MSTAVTDVEKTQFALFENYRRAPVAFTHGSGCRLVDTDGRSYLDFLAGIATVSLGHAHPRLVAALTDQVSRYTHVSNLYRIPEQEEAAQRLVEAAAGEGEPFLDRVFFCNSGAEANEAAIKLARRWGSDIPGPEGPRFEIIATQAGFHGRTLGALAATGTPAYYKGFEPLPGGFVHVPFNDLDAAAKAVGERTCAVLVEPVQGEGGVNPATPEYLQGLARLCKERGILFLLDEVQTGPGRTGAMFGFQYYGVEPDVISLAKGLGGGVPVGAVLARSELAAHLVPGTHGSTFGGNPLACRAVSTVLEVLSEEGVLAGVRAAGERLRQGLESLEGDGLVTAVRGIGLMQAVQLDGESAAVVAKCLEQGLLVGVVGPQAIRFLPPLVATPAEVDEALEIFAGVLRDR